MNIELGTLVKQIISLCLKQPSRCLVLCERVGGTVQTKSFFTFGQIVPNVCDEKQKKIGTGLLVELKLVVSRIGETIHEPRIPGV